MKRLVKLTFFIICSVGAMAQNRAKVIFSIFDEQTKQPLQGAVVEVAPKTEPNDKSYYTSGRGGYMEFSVSMGEYVVTAGEKVEAINYLTVDFICRDRPTIGHTSVVIMG